MVEITFEVHATTTDNEDQIATGHSPGQLSKLGFKQVQELGQRYESTNFAAVFCSDLRRASQTAEIAFKGQKVPVIKDARLRECDYGDFTGRSSAEVKAVKTKCIDNPFPNGQSYRQTTELVRNFLRELLQKYDGQKVLVIGHAATHYALEHLLTGVPLRAAIEAPWQWQPGWIYKLEKI